jgi:uncharacterized protein (TIGR00369 family)
MTTTFEFLKENIGATPYHKWLKPELIAVDDDKNLVTIRLQIRPDLCRLEGTTDLHGGVVSALVDIAGHAAVAGKLRHTVATIDMRVDYLRLAGGSFVEATASIVKLGRTIGVVDIRIEDDKKRLVAVGRASYLTAHI